MPLKNSVRLFRAQQNWSQGEFAARLGVSRQTVNAIETEKYDASLPLALKMAKLFNQPVENIFTAGIITPSITPSRDAKIDSRKKKPTTSGPLDADKGPTPEESVILPESSQPVDEWHLAAD
jgi:putative transcriptional regulator